MPEPTPDASRPCDRRAETLARARAAGPVVDPIETLFPGTRFRAPAYLFASVDSTNAFLAGLPAQDRVQGTLASAAFQTAGRGRQGRTWWSAPGSGLLFSILLKPPLPPADLPAASLAMAAGVVEAAKSWGIPAFYKWPNDVFANGRKLAGILAETSHAGGEASLIVGVGVNLRDASAQAPEPLRERMTSFEAFTHSPPQAMDVLHAVLAHFEYWYWQLPDHAAELAQTLAAPLTGRRARVSNGKETIEGAIVDVTPQGHLVLRRSDGSTATFASGDLMLDA